jgi:DNA-binding NarL/FixJ family response regulator
MAALSLVPSVHRAEVEFTRLHVPPAPTAPAADLDKITEREREVLMLVARGLSNTEIAQALTISHLLAKLGAHDRAQLVMIAYETRLVHPV